MQGIGWLFTLTVCLLWSPLATRGQCYPPPDLCMAGLYTTAVLVIRDTQELDNSWRWRWWRSFDLNYMYILHFNSKPSSHSESTSASLLWVCIFSVHVSVSVTVCLRMYEKSECFCSLQARARFLTSAPHFLKETGTSNMVSTPVCLQCMLGH